MQVRRYISEDDSEITDLFQFFDCCKNFGKKMVYNQLISYEKDQPISKISFTDNFIAKIYKYMAFEFS